MHKLLITIGFTGLCLVTHPALAERPRELPSTSPSDLARKCEDAGGRFSLGDKHYSCNAKGGFVVCELKTQKCYGGARDRVAGPNGTHGNALPNAGPKRFGAGGSKGGDGSQVAPGAMGGLGNATKFPGASAAPSAGGVFTDTKPVASVAGGAVTPTSPMHSTGGLLAGTRTGQGIGPLTGTSNGRLPR